MRRIIYIHDKTKPGPYEGSTYIIGIEKPDNYNFGSFNLQCKTMAGLNLFGPQVTYPFKTFKPFRTLLILIHHDSGTPHVVEKCYDVILELIGNSYRLLQSKSVSYI
jgi:hypothetical protein